MPKFVSFDKLHILTDELFVRVPLSCPLCSFLFRDSQDHLSFDEFGCCVECRDYFVWPNKARWLTGWRPGQETILKFRQNRISVPSYIVRG